MAVCQSAVVMYTLQQLACFMVCNELLGSIVVQSTPFKASNDAICGIIDLVHGYSVLVASSCQDSGFVHQIFQVSTTETGSSLGNLCQGDSLQTVWASVYILCRVEDIKITNQRQIICLPYHPKTSQTKQ